MEPFEFLLQRVYIRKAGAAAGYSSSCNRQLIILP